MRYCITVQYITKLSLSRTAGAKWQLSRAESGSAKPLPIWKKMRVLRGRLKHIQANRDNNTSADRTRLDCLTSMADMTH